MDKVEENLDAKPRLWVISELYYPEETSTGYYLTRIAEAMTSKFEVKAISGQPNYSARGTVAPRNEFHNGVEIFRVAGTTLDKNVIVFRLANMITLSLSVLFTGLWRFRAGDRVLVVTNPPTVPFVAALAALIRGSAYSLLIHDNYPEILVAAGKARGTSFVVRAISFLNRWLYKHASKIIVVGRDMKELLARKTAGLDVPIETIPNWAELETVSPAPRSENRMLSELGLTGRFVILYAGNIGPPNDIESIVEAASYFAGEEIFSFVFLGSGAKKPWLQRQVAERSLSNVVLLEPRPRSEQIDFLNACDLAVVSLVDRMLGVSVPSRTYNILAAGKPILAITDENSEVARIVREEQIGWIVPPGDPERLIQALRTACAAREQLPEMGRRARQAAEAKYSLEVASRSYLNAID